MNLVLQILDQGHEFTELLKRSVYHPFHIVWSVFCLFCIDPDMVSELSISKITQTEPIFLPCHLCSGIFWGMEVTGTMAPHPVEATLMNRLPVLRRQP
ncbi:MAG: hypothetical protein HXS43_06920 [Theionarchaea archaeon]|nr:hypothetical protein [Theionarchaea archaeon]